MLAPALSLDVQAHMSDSEEVEVDGWEDGVDDESVDSDTQAQDDTATVKAARRAMHAHMAADAARLVAHMLDPQAQMDEDDDSAGHGTSGVADGEKTLQLQAEAEVHEAQIEQASKLAWAEPATDSDVETYCTSEVEPAVRDLDREALQAWCIGNGGWTPGRNPGFAL